MPSLHITILPKLHAKDLPSILSTAIIILIKEFMSEENNHGIRFMIRDITDLNIFLLFKCILLDQTEWYSEESLMVPFKCYSNNGKWYNYECSDFLSPK